MWNNIIRHNMLSSISRFYRLNAKAAGVRHRESLCIFVPVLRSADRKNA